MKNVFYLMLLVPVIAISQTATEYAVFENGMITAHPAKITEFEAGMAAHNKKYHAESPYGARVYWISNGSNVGSYMWVMGPLPWSALDNRPAQEGHDADWNTNVLPYMMPEGNQTYWKFEAALSHFPKDFNIAKLHINMFDIKRFQRQKALELVKKIQRVMVEKLPEDTYGIYTNELPSTKEGRDMVFVSFFDKFSWMGEDIEFPKKFNEVHGEGAFADFLKEWGEVTHGGEQELWIFREDLSGLSGAVQAASRE
ncbi:hypothetical protein [Spongiimicrobium sp. 3-5]|uniref:hypothetical protein n=1 Tax=Spongiimicrobium sp. 3-5 TaxID=3332596 RepID=UPI00397EAF88